MRLFNPLYLSDDPTETYTNYDVSTPIASLIDGTGGVGAWDDLGSGTVYGDVVVSAADNGTFISIFLNAAAIADANAAAGGLFAIGGAVTTLGGDTEIIFGLSGGGNASDTQLIVKVPEPGTLTVLAAMGLGVRRRRRR